MDWWPALPGGACVATVGGEDDGLDSTKAKQLTRFVGGANITIHTSRSRRLKGSCASVIYEAQAGADTQSVPERRLHAHKTPAGPIPVRV